MNKKNLTHYDDWCQSYLSQNFIMLFNKNEQTENHLLARHNNIDMLHE